MPEAYRKRLMALLRSSWPAGKTRPEGRLTLLDSEKKRAYFLEQGGARFFLKCWGVLAEETPAQTRVRVVNEQAALALLARRRFVAAPRVRFFRDRPFRCGGPVMVTDFFDDQAGLSLNREQLLASADLVVQLHRVRGKRYSLPGGRLTRCRAGSGLEAVRSYWEALRRHYRTAVDERVLRLVRRTVSVDGALRGLAAMIHRSAPAFQSVRSFALVHGQLVRTRVKKHILCPHDGRIRFVDWEGCRFGEPEMEIASFFERNVSMASADKMLFCDRYRQQADLALGKIRVYTGLIMLEELLSLIPPMAQGLCQATPAPEREELVSRYFRASRRLAHQLETS